MSRLYQKRYLLPLAIVLLGIFLLLRVFSAEAPILIPEDVDVLLLVLFLGLTVVFALRALVSIWMHYLRLLTIRRLRRETLAEHSRFLRRLDHELKNPLTTLRAGLKTLMLTDLDEQQRQVVETMETDTLRLSRLVADLRKLASLEAQPLNQRSFDIEPFVRNIVQIEQERFEAGGRRFSSEVQPKSQASWTADEDLLSLAVHNILDNAFKYTQPGDAIHLSVSTDQELCIEVHDSGSGIAPPDLPHVSEELYRAKHVQNIPGSGVGLALVKAIVERHDGSLYIHSSPGEGVAVFLRIPPPQ